MIPVSNRIRRLTSISKESACKWFKNKQKQKDILMRAWLHIRKVLQKKDARHIMNFDCRTYGKTNNLKMKTPSVTTRQDTHPISPKKPTCIAERPWTSWPPSHHWSGLWTSATMGTSGRIMKRIHKIKEMNCKITLCKWKGCRKL